MRKVIAILAVMIFLGSVSAYAIDIGFSYRANTGDKELDVALGNLNAQAKQDRESVILGLSASYGLPRIEIERLLRDVKMTAADIYMAIKIGNLVRKPLSLVIDEYKANRGKGWGVIAQRLGIKPGSPAFRTLKDGASVVLERAKGKSKAKHKSASEAPAPAKGRKNK